MIWFTALCVALVGPARAAIEQAEVTGGTVQGTVDHGVAAFKGLPFAAPPVAGKRHSRSFPGPASSKLALSHCLAPRARELRQSRARIAFI
jgi:carboxylesterase type B